MSANKSAVFFLFSGRFILKLEQLSSWLAAGLVATVPALVAADSGGVLPWTQWALGGASGGILLLTIPTCLSTNRVKSVRAGLVAVALFLVAMLGALQTLHLPKALLAIVAPASAEIYENISNTISMVSHADLTDRINENPSLSIATWLTRQSVSLMVVFAVFAFTASQLFVTRSRITLLLACIAITGAMQAGLGIYQVVFDPTTTVWGIKSFLGGVPFGTFVCRNNAAVILNLGLASSLGLIAWRMAAITGASISGDEFPVTEWLDVAFDRIAMIGIVCSLFCLAGLLACGSRGGLVGAVAGLLLAFGLVQSLHRGTGFVPLLLAIALMAAILLINFDIPTRTIERLQGTPDVLFTDEGIRDGRIEHWKDGFRTAMAQPVFGWGVGTYRYAYLPHQKSSSGVWFVNADNLWLEWLVEMGVVGIIVLCVSLAFVIHSLHRLNASPDPIDHGLASAGWFALGALGVSQIFDFGLRIPANSLVTTVLASAVVSRSTFIGSFSDVSSDRDPSFDETRIASNQDFKSTSKFRNAHAVPVWFGLVVGLMLIPAIGSLDSHARGDYLSRLARHLPRSGQFNREVAEVIQGSLVSYVASHPDDSHAIIELTRLSVDLARFDAAKVAANDSQSADWLANYQALSPSTLRSMWFTQTAAKAIDDNKIGVHETIVRNHLDHEISTLLPYRVKEVAVGNSPTHVQPSAVPMSLEDQRLTYGTALHDARTLAILAILACPLSDEAHAEVIGLDFAGGSAEQTEILVNALINLRCKHGGSLLFAGRLAAQAKLWKLAASAWVQSMRVQPSLTLSVIGSYPADCPISLASILPNDVEVLAIAAQQELLKNKPEIAILTRAVELLEQSQASDRTDQLKQLGLLARIYVKRGQLNRANETLAKAILLAPGDLDTRYQYVLTLRESGNISEARQQARAGRQIAPSDSRFEQLLTSMSRVIEGTDE